MVLAHSLEIGAVVQTASVSTSATTVASDLNPAALVLVFGVSSGAAFLDVVLFGLGVSPSDVHQFTANGSPANRTYSRAGDDLQLAMASGSYTVQTKAVIVSIA